MGADQWQALSRWEKPETLAALVEFIVLARDRQHPTPRDGCRLHVVHGEHPASATAIRHAAALGKMKIPWVHPQVADWITTHRLYSPGSYETGCWSPVSSLSFPGRAREGGC